MPRFRWLFWVLGAVLLLSGATLVRTARATQPHRVSGSVADYAMYTGSSGGYVKNQLVLHGRGTTYTLHAPDFSPHLPQQLYEDGPVTVWTDGATGNTVIALTLANAADVSPTRYVTDAYLHPDHARERQRALGLLLAVLGLLCIAGAEWWAYRLRSAARRAAVGTLAVTALVGARARSGGRS